MGLVAECAGVFEFLGQCFDAMPNAVKMLAVAAFGGMVFIAVIKSIQR